MNMSGDSCDNTALRYGLDDREFSRSRDVKLTMTPSRAGVKNAWRYTSTLQYAFMAWCSVKAHGQLHLFLLSFYRCM